MERCSARGSDELVMADVRQLQEWVRSEADKRVATAEKRHRSELEAFTEQMRLKDERLDSLRWQLLTAELELKRVHSHSDGLDGSLSRAREENVRLEAVLAEREKELKSVRDRFTLHVLGCRRRSVPPLISSQTQQDRKAAKGAWRGNGREKGAREMKGPGVISVRDLLGLELENDEIYDGEELGQVMLNPPEASCIVTSKRQMKARPNDQEQNMEEEGCQEKAAMNTTATCSAVETPTLYENRDKHRNSITEAQVVLVPGQHPQGDSDGEDTIEEEEEKEVVMDPSCGTGINNHRLALHGEEEENPTTSCEISPVSEKRNLKQQYCPAANYRWKAEDLHAMGVSYKIKRLRQQIVVLEKLASGGSKDSSGKKSLKGFSVLVSLLAKQVKRYQSLQEKTDDLCSRMTEKERDDGAKGHHGRRRSTSCNTTEELERFLEETFQLQRYVVATGQKLTEIQSRIALSSLVGGGGGAGEEMGERAGFRMGQFADIVRGLLRDVQRGFEVRIARVIGSIEGTLASEGIRLI